MSTSLDIIHEDDDILAISKPSGLVVNNSVTALDETAQDMVLEYLGSETFADYGEDVDFVRRSGLAHRIDKDTSGVLLFAKNIEAFESLLASFKSREVEKEYVAVVNGKLPDEFVEVDAPIKRNPNRRFRFAIVADGKQSLTTFHQIESFTIENQEYSLVRAFPKTGRTHQIRVHLSGLNCPIAGDILYSAKSQHEISFTHFGRLMLHANKLTLTHPNTKEKITFVSPLPKVFKTKK